MPMKWTLEVCKKEALKYQTISEFKKANKSAYNSVLNSHRKHKSEIFSHMTVVRDYSKFHMVWTKKNVLNEAKKYKTRDEFHKKSCTAYKYAGKNGWMKQACLHMTPTIELHNQKRYWTFQRCKVEAKKYQSRVEFKKSATGAYSRALKDQWLNKICKHMTPAKELFKLKMIKWTFERCKTEALKSPFDHF